MKGFGKLGESYEEEKDDDERESSDSFSDQGGQMAMRALAKALGADPGSVDTKAAIKAFRALMAACG